MFINIAQMRYAELAAHQHLLSSFPSSGFCLKVVHNYRIWGILEQGLVVLSFIERNNSRRPDESWKQRNLRNVYGEQALDFPLSYCFSIVLLTHVIKPPLDCSLSLQVAFCRQQRLNLKKLSYACMYMKICTFHNRYTFD